jgi:hypothetical protein
MDEIWGLSFESVAMSSDSTRKNPTMDERCKARKKGINDTHNERNDFVIRTNFCDVNRDRSEGVCLIDEM